MTFEIQNEINDIKQDIVQLQRLEDCNLFGLLCLKYFYNEGNLSYSDYKDTFTDGKNDGGIDLITIEEQEDQKYLILIQTKMITQLWNKQEIINTFMQISNTIKDLEEFRTTNLNERIKRLYRDKISSFDDEMYVTQLVFFINTKIPSNKKEKLEHYIQRLDSLDGYQISIYDQADILDKIESVKQPQRYVSEAKIKFDKQNGVIKYHDNGLLINISAKSLNELFDRFKDKGLFEQNFRYYIRNKKIDNSILKTISEKPEKFWFMNNGIIIGCNDFRVDGDRVCLENFSIINGCQTTTLIGTYSEGLKNDFYLPCKIVKPAPNDDVDTFISEIAESSNSQKPISDRDLKANKQEQIKLQNLLQRNVPKIYLEIKRGKQIISRSKKHQLYPWQYLRNDLFAQILISFIFQQPGIARSGKRKIFEIDKYYNKVFKRTCDKDSIVDILRLHSDYRDFVERSLQNESFSDIEKENIANNGTFVILAILGFLLKTKRSLIDHTKIRNLADWEDEISHDDIDSTILNLDDSGFDKKRDSLFMMIINNLTDLYLKRKEEEKTVSNFFKKDINYRNIILKSIIDNFYQSSFRKEELDSYMTIFY